MSIASFSRNSSQELLSPTRQTTLKFSPISSCFGRAIERDPVDQDLREVHKHERRVFALNDQFVALNRVIKETANSNERETNEVRKRKMQIHEHQQSLQSREKTVEDLLPKYNAACERQQRAIQEKESIQERLKEMEKALSTLCEETQKAYTELSTEEVTDTTEYDEKWQASRIAQGKLKIVRDRKQVLAGEFKDSERKKREMDVEEKRLNELRGAYEKKLDGLLKRIDKAKRQMSQPCDELVIETAFVESLERDAEELEKQNFETVETKLEEDIVAAQERCDAFLEVVMQRRRVLRQAQAELTSLKMSLGLIDKAESVATRGTSVISAMVNMEAKLAQDVVKKVFKKLERRQDDLESVQVEATRLEEKYRGSRSVVEEDWHKKMKRVAELTAELAKFESLEIEVAAAKQKSNNLRQEIMDNEYKIRHLTLMNSKYSKMKGSNQEYADDLAPIRERIAEKQRKLDEKEPTVAEKREAVAGAKSQVEETQKQVDEQEKSTCDLEEKLDEAFKELESQTLQVSRDYDALSVCKLLSRENDP